MSTKQMPWFRAYTEMIDDEKLRLLAFEDRWHFVGLLCLKGQGVLEDGDPLMMRKVAVKLGIDMRTLEEVARRLAEVGLINQETLQPLAWDSRQMKSDTSAERTRAYRERQKRHRDVTVTPQEVDTETDKEEETDKDKNISPAQAQASAPATAKPAAKPRAAAKTPLPPDFAISDAVQAWAEREGHSADLQLHFDHFVGAALAKGYRYVNWDQALMNAIRTDWAKVRERPRARHPSARQSQAEQSKADFLRIIGQPDTNTIDMGEAYASR